MPVRKVRPDEPNLSGVFDISLSPSYDDTYSGSHKGKGGQDNQSDDQDGLSDAELLNKKASLAKNGISIFA